MNSEKILAALNDYISDIYKAIEQVESEYAKDNIDTETHFKRVTDLGQLLSVSYRYRALIKRRTR